MDNADKQNDLQKPGGRLLTWWLWFAIITVVVGAFMLYPIGTTLTNVLFIIVKIGMGAGIIALLVTRSMKSFCFWATFSALAVVMTIVKWNLGGAFDPTYALAIVTDIAVPSVALGLLKRPFR